MIANVWTDREYINYGLHCSGLVILKARAEVMVFTQCLSLGATQIRELRGILQL